MDQAAVSGTRSSTSVPPEPPALMFNVPWHRSARGAKVSEAPTGASAGFLTDALAVVAHTQHDFGVVDPNLDIHRGCAGMAHDVRQRLACATHQFAGDALGNRRVDRSVEDDARFEAERLRGSRVMAMIRPRRLRSSSDVARPTSKMTVRM